MTEPDNDKAHWIVGAVKTVGVPTVFLGILLYMIYSSGRWAGIEVVVPLFKKQTEFIDRTAAVVEEIRDAVVTHQLKENEQMEILKEIADNTKPKP